MTDHKSEGRSTDKYELHRTSSLTYFYQQKMTTCRLHSLNKKSTSYRQKIKSMSVCVWGGDISDSNYNHKASCRNCNNKMLNPNMYHSPLRIFFCKPAQFNKSIYSPLNSQIPLTNMSFYLFPSNYVSFIIIHNAIVN